jgi:3-hydroxybutyryl-CoA dehydrogenase
VTAISGAVANPSRFAGMHFFNPPVRMPVVEIVRVATTGDTTVRALAGVAAALGQRAFVVADTPGFLVNHIGRAYTGEALRLFEEGIAPAAELDRIARGALHFKMGPFELLDLVGRDVSAEVTEQIWRGFGEEPRFHPAPVVRARVAAGLLGRKSGCGFYDYDSGGRPLPPADSRVMAPPAPVRLVGFVDGAREQIAALLPGDLVTDDGAAIALVGPVGCTVATEARRHGLDPARAVGIDPLFTGLATLAGPPAATAAVAAGIRAAGYPVASVADGPGMPAQRIVTMMVLVAAEAAAAGIGSRQDIDAAARLALAYPRGPLELGDAIGAGRIAAIAAGLFAATGDRRWRPSAWLDRDASSGTGLAQSQLPQQLASN